MPSRKHNDLINFIEDAVSKEITYWSKARSLNDEVDGVYSDVRDTDTIGITYNLPYSNQNPADEFRYLMSKLFYDTFTAAENDYKSSNGCTTRTHEMYTILKYGVGQKFINHVDDHPDFPRTVSTVYYINDDYTGGEIFFPKFDLLYKPKANELLVFPSTFVYMHSVNAVESGTRYAVVSWLN